MLYKTLLFFWSTSSKNIFLIVCLTKVNFINKYCLNSVLYFIKLVITVFSSNSSSSSNSIEILFLSSHFSMLALLWSPSEPIGPGSETKSASLEENRHSYLMHSTFELAWFSLEVGAFKSGPEQIWWWPKFNLFNWN